MSGWKALFAGKGWVVSLALGGGVGLHAINLYVSTTMLPSVVRDIGGFEYYAWNTTVFVMASILGATLSPRMLALAGPGRGYACGACLFAVGSTVCALAPTMVAMLAGRGVQGLGGGLLLALAYALVRRVYAEPLWPRALALLSGTWGAATFLGPAVGGVFAELGHWRAAFGSLALAALLLNAVSMRALPGRDADGPAGGREPLPWPQFVLLAGAIVAVSSGSLAGSAKWIGGSLAIAFVLVQAFVWIEVRSSGRLLPQGALCGTSPIGWLYGLSALMAVTVTCTEIFLPLFLQELQGFSPLVAGYVAAVMSAGWTLAAVTSAGLRGRVLHGAVRLGPILSVFSLVVLALALPAISGGQSRMLAVVLPALLAGGMGVGLTYPHLCARIMQVAPTGDADRAASAIMTVQLCATAFGAAIAGLIVNVTGARGGSDTLDVANAARWLFAAVALAPVACVALMRKGWK